MNKPNYTVTTESITVIWEGKPYVVQKGTPNYEGLRKTIMGENWEEIPNHLTAGKGLESWAKGKITVQDDVVSYEGTPLPTALNRRISDMAGRGESPVPIFNFWARLKKNPSYRSVNQLWDFLNHAGIPLTPDGCFLAYKGVNHDYTDRHSGKFSNKPGTIQEMPRNQISDDPDLACHDGFHVGALRYARSFSTGQLVVCKVDPEHVVCVPKDSSQEKMRVCKYVVLGNYGTQLPDTAVETDAYLEYENELDESITVETTALGAPLPPKDKPAKKPVREKKKHKEARRAQAQADTKTHVKQSALSSDQRAEFRKYDKMDMYELIALQIEDLRRYATYSVKIVGASKIPGGKTALVARILEIRD